MPVQPINYPYRSPYTDTIAQLLARQGDVAAQGAANSGAIWGRAVEQLGGIAAGAVQQHQENQAIKRRQELVNQALDTWDGDPKSLYKSLLPTLGPERTMDIVRGARAVLAPEPLDWKGAAITVKAARQLYETGGDEAMAKAWPVLGRKLSRFGEEIGQPVPQEYTPEIGQNIVGWDNLFSKPAEPKAPERVEQNGQVFERQADGTWAPAKGIPIETPKPEKAGSLDMQLAAAYEAGDEAKIKSILAIKAREAAATRAPKDGTGTGLSPVAESNIINRLTTQWTKASGTTVELNRQASLMEKGIQAAERGDLAAGSQAVLVTFQKILDPTSVVRESEYARSASGQALLARIEGAAEQLVKGGAGVPVSELKKFQRLAREFISGNSEYLKSVKKRIGLTADRYKIPHEVIFEDYNLTGETSAEADDGGGWTNMAGGIRIREKK